MTMTIELGNGKIELDLSDSPEGRLTVFSEGAVLTGFPVDPKDCDRLATFFARSKEVLLGQPIDMSPY